MTGPQAAFLPDGRLHLHHGPIDLIIMAEGPGAARAHQAARDRFATLLSELVSELPRLRSAVSTGFAGETAQRMARAVAPFQPDLFVTPMAAVAGAVADTILAAMLAAADLTRAAVNNGGDIALHLAPGQAFRLAMAHPGGADLGRVVIGAGDGVGGIATSGHGGRSHSLGIADSVTVLARSAAQADAAATLIANAVNTDHPGIQRSPAQDLSPDSDLGARLVTTHLPTLPQPVIDAALNAGLAQAQGFAQAGHITSAALFLQGHARLLPLSERLTHVPA